MIKSYTLFSALERLTPDHKPVRAYDKDGRGTPGIIYVRAVANDFDYNEAMDRVEPMDGENFLNTVPAHV